MASTDNNELDEEEKIFGKVIGQLLLIVALVFVCGFIINRHNSEGHDNSQKVLVGVESVGQTDSVELTDTEILTD